MVPAIDVHTHMLSHEWLESIEKFGGPDYAVKRLPGDTGTISFRGAPFFTLLPGMFDWDARIRNMDLARVDVAIVSLTTPSVYWGGEKVSAAAARAINDDFASAQRSHRGRIRWLASLPWQYPKAAVTELRRAVKNGALGVMVMANIHGEHLTEPQFEPIWAAIDKLELPVLVHPCTPPGADALGLKKYRLTPAIGFPFDTTLAVARMVFDGFLDRHTRLKIIASHGGGALPFLAGRMDMCWDKMPDSRENTPEPPRDVLRRVYADAVVYRQDALEMAVSVFGTDNIMYGSDYPHNGGDPVGCLARVDALRNGVRDKVRGLNAQRLFKI